MNRILFAAGMFMFGCGSSDSEQFMSDVTYDTLSIVGGAAEQRPLFLYGSPVPRLVDDSTIVYADAKLPGRMVTVNMLSGEGWEVFTGPDAEGPGEFGGGQPLVEPSRGVIHTVTRDRLFYNAWRKDGTLIRSAKYPDISLLTSGLYSHLVGLMGSRAVVLRAELLEGDLVRRSVQIYDPDRGLVASITQGIPQYSVRIANGGDGDTRLESIDEIPIAIAARGGTLVWGLTGQTRLTTVDTEGNERASRELESPLLGLFLDADERIWAGTSSRDTEGSIGTIVLDRNLDVLFRASVRWAVDASGEYVLAFLTDKASGARQMVLLKMNRQR